MYLRHREFCYSMSTVDHIHAAHSPENLRLIGDLVKTLTVDDLMLLYSVRTHNASLLTNSRQHNEANWKLAQQLTEEAHRFSSLVNSASVEEQLRQEEEEVAESEEQVAPSPATDPKQDLASVAKALQGNATPRSSRRSLSTKQ